MPCSGVVAQLVRASACHAEGRGFEPLQSRQINKKHIRNDVFFYLALGIKTSCPALHLYKIMVW